MTEEKKTTLDLDGATVGTNEFRLYSVSTSPEPLTSAEIKEMERKCREPGNLFGAKRKTWKQRLFGHLVLVWFTGF